jgi:hypothetical protein
MRLVIQLAFAAALISPLGRAAGPEDEIVAAVQSIFNAMAAKDAAALRDAFLPDARLVAVLPDGRVTDSAAAEWSAKIGGMAEPILERMWSPKVQIDGSLATLWAPYDFHRAGKFSHCGTDVVVLVRQQGAWKVSSLAYTVKREGCEPSPLGPPKP